MKSLNLKWIRMLSCLYNLMIYLFSCVLELMKYSIELFYESSRIWVEFCNDKIIFVSCIDSDQPNCVIEINIRPSFHRQIRYYSRIPIYTQCMLFLEQTSSYQGHMEYNLFQNNIVVIVDLSWH